MPELGRWVTSDPLAAIALGISPYAYCYNNPINYVDPTGMFGEEDEQGRKRFDSFTGAYIAPMDRAEGLNDTDRANRDTQRQREGRTREVTDDDIAASYTFQEYGTDTYSRGELVSHTPEGYYLVPSSAQQGAEAQFNEFVKFFFQKQLNQLGSTDNIRWLINDPELDLRGYAGLATQREDETVLIRISVAAMNDPKLLYQTVGHELIHAADFLSCRRANWSDAIGNDYDWYGKKAVLDLIMHYYAYSWEADVEEKFGTDYGGRRELEYTKSEIKDLGLEWTIKK